MKRVGRWVMLVALIAGLITCGPGDLRVLSDQDLLDYAASSYDVATIQSMHVRLGVHRGTLVVVDFICSDVCPDYTRRVIHYDLKPDQACTSKGGVVEQIAVIFLADNPYRAYCVPPVLAGKAYTYR
jgi:hypothetical protein